MSKTLSILQSDELLDNLSKNSVNITNRYWSQNFDKQLKDIFYSLQ
jgi:hypothetical protein